MNYTLLFLLTLVSCQDYNSNSGDRAKYGPIMSSGNVQLDAATAVIKSRCISCHDRYHDNWADLKTNEETFSNILIDSDGDNASVAFDFSYMRDGRITNVGREYWLLARTEMGWKIAAVTYSRNFPTKSQ